MLTKDDQEVADDEILRYVQTFKVDPPMCDEYNCVERALNFFARPNGKAIALCVEHESGFKNTTVLRAYEVLQEYKNFIRSK